MEASPSSTPGLKRSLSVWAAVGLSVALMAPSMAANINPQGSAAACGPRRAADLPHRGGRRAPGGLLIRPAVPVLPPRRARCTRSSAPRSARGPGSSSYWGLLGTYTFYAVVTSAASRRSSAPRSCRRSASGTTRRPGRRSCCSRWRCCSALWLAIIAGQARRAAVLLSVEGTTVALILVVTAVVLVRLLAGTRRAGTRSR